MMQATERNAKLAVLLRRDMITVAPGACDAFTARIVEMTGFDAVYMSGSAVAASLGKPDVGLVSFKEVLDRASQLVEGVDIPLIVDADTGYGGLLNAVRTAREFERAGVSAIQLEDQEFPKKCGVFGGKRLVSKEEMVGKIRACIDARYDPNFLVIARTDAIDVEGLQRAIERALAYKAAGADLLMFSGPREQDLKEIVTKTAHPLVYINAEGIATRALISVSDLEALGVKLVIFPLTAILSAARAVVGNLSELRRTGTTKHIVPQLMTWGEYNEILGLDAAAALENRYSSSQ